MAPMLSFTAEEAWAVFAEPEAYCRQRRDHFHADLLGAAGSRRTRAALLEKYTALREVRADVTKQLEEVRVAGGIGSSLQAEVSHQGAAAISYKLLASLDDDLRFVFITSAGQGVASGNAEAGRA